MPQYEAKLTYNDSDLRNGVAGYLNHVNLLVAGLFQAAGDAATGYMKTNAPWHDRTGNARSGLHAVAESEGNTHTLVLAHGVPYGIWLEVRFAGRFAILPQSIQWTAAWIMRGLDK